MGEILLSLSYLPTAERLTVVVVKAKNLIWNNDKTTAGKALGAGRHRTQGPVELPWSPGAGATIGPPQ